MKFQLTEDMERTVKFNPDQEITLKIQVVSSDDSAAIAYKNGLYNVYLLDSENAVKKSAKNLKTLKSVEDWFDANEIKLSSPNEFQRRKTLMAYVNGSALMSVTDAARLRKTTTAQIKRELEKSFSNSVVTYKYEEVEILK